MKTRAFWVGVFLCLVSLPAKAAVIPIDISGWFQFNIDQQTANSFVASPPASVYGVAVSRGEATGLSATISEGSVGGTEVRFEFYGANFGSLLQSETFAVTGLATPVAFDFGASIMALSAIDIGIYVDVDGGGGVSTLSLLSALTLPAGTVGVADLTFTTGSPPVRVGTPPTLALLGLGLVALALRKRKN